MIRIVYLLKTNGIIWYGGTYFDYSLPVVVETLYVAVAAVAIAFPLLCHRHVAYVPIATAVVAIGTMGIVAIAFSFLCHRHVSIAAVVVVVVAAPAVGRSLHVAYVPIAAVVVVVVAVLCAFVVAVDC